MFDLHTNYNKIFGVEENNFTVFHDYSKWTQASSEVVIVEEAALHIVDFWTLSIYLQPVN